MKIFDKGMLLFLFDLTTNDQSRLCVAMEKTALAKCYGQFAMKPHPRQSTIANFFFCWADDSFFMLAWCYFRSLLIKFLSTCSFWFCVRRERDRARETEREKRQKKLEWNWIFYAYLFLLGFKTINKIRWSSRITAHNWHVKRVAQNIQHRTEFAKNQRVEQQQKIRGNNNRKNV